jgi:pimeloyl-ACP methyl ester carboxylesterase
MKQSEIPQRPPSNLLIGELRSVADVLTMPLNFLGASQATGPARPVILIPGFGAGDWSMRPLGLYLQRHGFETEGWGLGVNRAGLDIPHTLADIGRGWSVRPIEPYRGEGGVAVLVDKMVGRVAARASALGEPVTLVGWSLGGTIAREIARDVPGAVHHVITLGSPFIGGPKYTVAGKRLENRGLNLDWIENQVRRRENRPVKVPITAVVSPSDAIVDFRATRDHFSENVEHVELDVPHLSMGFNRHVWRIILQTLQRAEDREGVAPFDTAKKGDTTCRPRLS